MNATSITTRYTVLGYVVERISADGRIDEVARGGNHPMCSESVLVPLERFEDPMVRPLVLAQIKKLARITHNDVLAETPGATDGGVSHDKDSQDEEMAMLGRPDKMRQGPRKAYMAEEARRAERRKRAYAWIFS